MAAVYNGELAKALKTSSLTMKGDACTSVRKHLQARFGLHLEGGVVADVRAELALILAQIKEGGLQSSVVTLEQVDLALGALTSGGADESNKKVIDVISAFDMPRFHYDGVRKTFHAVQHERTKFGSAEDKADMLRARYELLMQRLQRIPEFQARSTHAAASSNRMDDGEDGGDEAMQIVTIEALMGQVGKRCIFGQLAQLTEGVYSLEDIHSHITLNLNSPQLILTSGLFTEGCMVLAEGEVMDDGAFHAATLISPPAETRQKTISVFPQLDWLESDLSGGSASAAQRTPEQQLKHRLLTSPEHENDMIIMLSDVHLDKPAVLAKLALMLEGFIKANSVPCAFVFMGNFTSRPFASQPGETARLTAAFDSLADLLGKFAALCRESHFVFIPGPGDLPLSMASCLPAPGLPEVFTGKLREKLQHVTFASNPCRLSWVTRELVFFREDLLHKMRRSCIRPPTELETSDVSQHLVKTLIDQAHLTPLTASVRPIYWNYDHAMRLYPLPDVLVLADCVDQYEWPYQGVRALNPGTFAHDFSFVVFFPAQDKVEFSRIDPPKA